MKNKMAEIHREAEQKRAMIEATRGQDCLKLSTYSTLDGVLYCKPHFEQFFKEKGGAPLKHSTSLGKQNELNRSPSKLSALFSGTQDKSAACKKTIYPLEKLLALGVVGFGIWMSAHHDGCRKSLTLPVLALGGVIFVISIVGFLGAWKNNSILLWIYLIMLCLILVAILVFTVLAFIVTNNGSGHSVNGLRYKEYQLQDYSSWFLKQLNNTHNWKHLKSCLVKADDCSNLSKRYKNLKQYKLAKLTPIEAGCCRPPSECGYPAINASYYDLSFHPTSSSKDCKLYKNSKNVKCYNCDSCKAGVAQYMKTEWRVVAIFNVILFAVLSIIYFVGCCARRNAAQSRSKV